MLRWLPIATLLPAVALAPDVGLAQPAPAEYQATFYRAAPGHLLDLVERLRSRLPVSEQAGEPRPVLLRHAQGDHWDLLLLTPIGTMAERFSRQRAGRWASAARRVGFDEAGYQADLDRWVSWREDLFVTGPPVAELEAAAAANGYFHLEIFQALAGMRDSLLRQREMENRFLARIGRPTNFVFRRIGGAGWDCFTLGLYRDLPHYAEPSRATAEEEDRAARDAGFESRGHIGAYLRRFLNGHHDTIGPIVR